MYLFAGLLLLIAAAAGKIYSNSLHRRARQVLRAVESALAGEGRITQARWSSPRSLQLALKLNSGTFRRPSLTLELAPRRALDLLRRNRADSDPNESLLFQADLDEPPNFNLEVGSQSCWGRSRPNLDLEHGEWKFVEAEPLVLSSNEHLDRDTSGTLNALIAARSQDFMDLRFQPRSPHFSASLPLSLLPRLAANGPSLFGLLSDLAREASTSKS